jgi:hypothetical protein
MAGLIGTLLAGFTSFTNPAKAGDSCPSLRQIASVEISTGPFGDVSVPIAISGHQTHFGIVTQERFSAIKSSSAAGLAMPLEPIKAYQLGIEDTRLHNYAVANPMKLGELADTVRFVVLPDNDIASGVSGFLSTDFLKNYDIEFDFAQGRLNIFSQDHCTGGVVYWTHDVAARIPMDVDAWGRIKISAELDGKPIEASLGTGYTESQLYIWQNETMFADQMSQWRVIDNNSGAPVGYKRTDTTYEHTFKSLSLEGLAIGNPTIKIESIERLLLKPHLYIGMDVLRRLHLYLAYREGSLYVTSASAH